MFKRIIIIALSLLPVAATAQKSEIALSGGIRSEGAYIASLGYYLKLWKVQVGAIGEFSAVDIAQPNIANENIKKPVLSPGINANFIISIPRGYVYPGIAARYAIGIDQKTLKGSEYGVHGGVVIRLIKSLSANAEAGVRVQNVKYDAAAMGVGKAYFTSSGSIATSTFTVSASYLYFPLTLGLRWSF